MTYAEYVGLIDRLLVEGKTTGPNQSEAMFGYGKLNRQRMQRLDKTVEITDEVRGIAGSVNRRMVWLTITEGWCGDAAQNIPVIEKIAAASGNIQSRYLLRDEHPELMDRFLTAGARSIPKLIAIDAETFQVIGTWGARPRVAQELFQSLKDARMPKHEIMEQLQRWYNSDKNSSLQAEFAELLQEWDCPTAAAACA